jgi:glycosyltransferase involved in cell wall biosynthesis
MTKVSVIIKALNEEANIARAIESSLRAVAPWGGEVIVADSVSSDATVDIAMRYPVRVVQFENAAERSCGAGGQLGWQHCTGEYVYILDGDMELDEAFLAKAIGMLESEPDLAGVGGFIPEMRASNLQFERRMKRVNERRATAAKVVKSLSGGGLYRRAAIEPLGYMFDRNLRGDEEYDLGSRLRTNGWRLVTLPDRAASHYSYDVGTLPLLWHRIRSGSYLSQGELLRAAIESGYAARVYNDVFAFRLSAAVIVFWLAALGGLLVLPWKGLVALIALACLLGLIGVVTYRHRSLASSLHSVLIWHLSAGGAIVGLFRRRLDPRGRIASRVLRDGGDGGARAAPVMETGRRA